jgi:PPM family protein phosphatase
VDLWEIPAVIGDRFLLCSDGLVDEVVDDAIADLLVHYTDPQQAAQELVRLANHNGGHDNISVVVVDVIDGRENEPPATYQAAGSLGSGPITGPVQITPSLPQPLLIEPYEASDEAQTDRDPSRHGAPQPAGRSRKSKRSGANRIRSVLFALVLLGIVGTIVGGVQYYGNVGTYVGFQGDQVSIFKGRAGGVLWVHPKLLQRSVLTKTKLSAAAIERVTKTVSFTDKAAASAWIDALSKNPNLAPGNMPATTTTAPTTTTTTTTVAPTTTTSTTLPGP